MAFTTFPQLTGLLIASAGLSLDTPATAQTTNKSIVAPPIEQSKKTDVEQVSQPAIDRAKATSGAVQQVTTAEKQPTRVTQLPADAELAPSAAGPEEGLEEAARPSPRVDLYREVASVWELIRKRGQQPTPELIAREIGPDNLAKFLTDFPGSANMFGVDSDSLPVSPPPPPPPSKGR